MKYLSEKFEVPIYLQYVDVVLTDDIVEYANENLYEDVDSTFDAFVIADGGCIRVVFSDKQLTPDMTAHEVVHIVNYIFSFSGVKLDMENDEPQAYLTGYVFKTIFDIIKKFKEESDS